MTSYSILIDNIISLKIGRTSYLRTQYEFHASRSLGRCIRVQYWKIIVASLARYVRKLLCRLQIYNNVPLPT
jgi:hypothetical protein